MDKNLERQLAEELAAREQASGINYEQPKVQPKEEPMVPGNLGVAEAFKLRDEGQKDWGPGWKPVPVENIPSSGMFYPIGTKIYIRSAQVQEVKQFSMIDENDPLDMDDKLNMVMERCLKIEFPDRHATWKDLKEEDRFYLIFAIREITFSTGENKLYVTVKCGQTCNGDGTFSEKIEMSKENFQYYDIDPTLMQYYSEVDRCFSITDTKLGGNLKIFVPSLGVTTFIKGYIRNKSQTGDFYDKPFLKVAPFVIEDWRGFNEDKYKRLEMESQGWSDFKWALLVRGIEMIRFGVKTQITRSCTKCGAEVGAPISFPGGVKSLFVISNPFGQLS